MEPAPEPEPEPEPSKQPMQRDIVISCSTLIRRWQEMPQQVLDGALFLFGSKRCWVFPQTDQERRDARRQPGTHCDGSFAGRRSAATLTLCWPCVPAGSCRALPQHAFRAAISNCCKGAEGRGALPQTQRPRV